MSEEWIEYGENAIVVTDVVAKLLNKRIVMVWRNAHI